MSIDSSDPVVPDISLEDFFTVEEVRLTALRRVYVAALHRIEAV